MRVAAEAGFAGIGLRAENYRDARNAGLDDAAMREILDRHGVAVMEVEYVTGWGTEQDRDAAQREKEETANTTRALSRNGIRQPHSWKARSGIQ